MERPTRCVELLHCGALKTVGANRISNKERGFAITYESPKSEGLALFKHGERVYDHLLILPGKSKGKPIRR